MSSARQAYVVGFMFDEKTETVVLISKERPAWQKGKMNGVGGKVEQGERPDHAMAREFREEAGVHTGPYDWHCFLVLDCPEQDCVVHFFRAWDSEAVKAACTITDENIYRSSVDFFWMDECVPNLYWIVPMAARMKDTELPVYLTYRGS